MKRKLLSLLVLFVGAAMGAWADTYQWTSGDCTVTLDEFGTLTVSGTGAMVDYDDDAPEWSEYDAFVTTVVVGSGVTHIGAYAFWGLSNLTALTLGNGSVTIGNEAFDECENLTTLTLAEGCTTIGDSEFYMPVPGLGVDDNQWWRLTTVNLPSTLTSIGDEAFRGCESLTTINLPEGLTSIGDLAFYRCSDLANLDLPDGLISIGVGTFKDCSSLTTVTIPSTVTEIGEDAFRYCDGLATLTLHEGLTTIGDCAFADCSSLTTVTIPSTVTEIGTYTFTGCSNLETLTMSNGWVNIGEYAFLACDNVKTLTLADGCTTIGDDEFAQWSSLTTVNLPSTLTSIGVDAFYECSALSTINLPEGLATIGSHAFAGCMSLTTVTIPSTVTEIGDYAFNGCENLSTINLLEGLTTIGDGAFDGCLSLTTVTIPSTVTSIGYETFCGCTSVTDVYCRPDAADLTWWNINNDFMDNAATKCHVRASQLRAYESKFGEESDSPVNVTFDGNLTKKMAETENNSTWITSNVDKEYEVQLTRTLQPNGWNTFCVPFTISSSQISSVFGAGTEVKKLTSSSFNAGTNVLTLNFDDASDIEAGKPYLVWIGSESNVANPTFSFVKIVDGTTTTVTDNADFVPVINPTSVTANDRDILFVSGGNKLTWPTNGNIYGFRAYFQLHDIATNARSFELCIDGEVNAIRNIEYSISNEGQSNGHSVYDLQGRQVSGQMSNGMYIVNGKKVFIK